jgi:predicted nucleic-acid-binding protein
VIALDTNVLVRWIVRDDPKQFARADAVMAEPFFLPISVFMELGWVLRSVYGFSRQDISKTAALVVSLPTTNIPFATNIRWAIERYAAGGDWEDMIHLATSTEADAFGSFDMRLSKQGGPNSPISIIDLNP